MSIEGEAMIPGEQPLHLYMKGCECAYCLPITRADQQRKADMEFADEYYNSRKAAEDKL